MFVDIDRLAAMYRDAGLNVNIMDGAHRRAARMYASSGYPAGGPRGSDKHHTAQNVLTSDASSMAYMTFNAPYPVMVNVYPHKQSDYTVTICAAGPTYTAGKGGPIGSIPQDRGNQYGWSWECPNNGVGEPWSRQLQETMVIGAAVECEFFKWEATRDRIFAHFEWAPGRKIDPYGPSKYTGGQNRMWDMDQFRSDVHLKHQELYNSPGDDDMPKTAAPSRVDSRTSQWQPTLPANQTREVWLACPADTKFAVVNVVALPKSSDRGWMSIGGEPFVAGRVGTTVNWTAGATVAQSQVTIPVLDGKKVFLHSNRDVDFVLDFTGTYW